MGYFPSPHSHALLPSPGILDVPRGSMPLAVATPSARAAYKYRQASTDRAQAVHERGRYSWRTVMTRGQDS